MTMQDKDQVQGDNSEEVKETNPMTTTEETSKESEATPTSKQETEQVLDDELEALENSKNPERTKEYIEKLKRERDEALKMSQDRPQENSVFDSFRGGDVNTQDVANKFSHLNNETVDNVVNDFVDENGNVDVQGLNKALREANAQAKQALEEAKRTKEEMTRFEETRQVTEAHSKHPELDPKSEKFDKRFYDLVKNRILSNMYEGKREDLTKVADELKSLYGGNKPQTSPSNQEQVKEARNQGPIETGTGEPRNSTGNLQELRQRTRQGDSRALDERLRNLGILD